MARSRSPRRPRSARLESISGTYVVYVHGICRHDPGFSDPWWAALKPHLTDIPDDHRREVLWSDLVNPAAPEAARRPEMLGRAAMELLRPRPAAEAGPDVIVQIKDILADRAHRQYVEASLQTSGPEGIAAQAATARPLLTGQTAAPEALIGIPGLDCLDDFGKYLRDDDIRQQVIARFHAVARPLLQNDARLEVISHSWGTVVAYEALRLLDEENTPDRLVHSWFTVGSALAIGPVKRQLLPEASDGQRPRTVQTWINLNARFDVVGGPLQGVPFEVDYEYLGLAPVGCSWLIPSPSCAHSSYFHPENDAVNREIFARHIQS